MGLTGIFLGAGASFELGMPLAWDLTNEIQNWLSPEKLKQLNESLRRQGGGYSDVVIEDFSRILVDPEMHYEAKLGYLQTQQLRYANRDNAQAYNGLYMWLVEMVYFLLYYRHVQNVDYIRRAIRFYRGLADLAQVHKPLWIFTLNHDVLIECIAAEYGVPLSAGLDLASAIPTRLGDGSPAGELGLESRTIEAIETQAFSFARLGTKGINLLKIHGALDLFVADDGRRLVRLRPQEYSTAGIIAALKIAHENLFYEIAGQRVKATNEITYSDRDGEMQFLRRSLLAGAYKFDSRGGQVLPQVMLKQFKTTINYVTELVCIGYSFGDSHINDVLSNWLEFGDQRRLVIVGPVTAKLPSFLLHLRPQIRCEAAAATEYFEQHSTQPLNFAERMQRTMLQNARLKVRRERGFA